MPRVRDGFRAEILARTGDSATLQVFGEIDLATMSRFEVVLDDLVSSRPTRAAIDVIGTQFISAAGYDAIGRCSEKVERLTVYARNGLAQKILDVLGYDDIVFVSPERPPREMVETEPTDANNSSSPTSTRTRAMGPAEQVGHLRAPDVLSNARRSSITPITRSENGRAMASGDELAVRE